MLEQCFGNHHRHHSSSHSCQLWVKMPKIIGTAYPLSEDTLLISIWFQSIINLDIYDMDFLRIFLALFSLESHTWPLNTHVTAFWVSSPLNDLSGLAGQQLSGSCLTPKRKRLLSPTIVSPQLPHRQENALLQVYDLQALNVHPIAWKLCGKVSKAQKFSIHPEVHLPRHLASVYV